MRKLGFKLLDLIGEGLGLNKGFSNGELTQDQTMGINHYPPCPDPSITLGVGGHIDPNLITLLQQDRYGLQIEKDGKWLGIEPIPNAFVVGLGIQLQVHIFFSVNTINYTPRLYLYLSKTRREPSTSIEGGTKLTLTPLYPSSKAHWFVLIDLVLQ